MGNSCMIFAYVVHVCLLFHIVDDPVCRVRLTHRRLDYRFLWNISFCSQSLMEFDTPLVGL